MNFLSASFYPLTEESYLLGEYAAKNFKQTQSVKVLDLCSGSGCVGLSFSLKYLGTLSSISFVEKQIEFKEFFEKNAKRVNLECPFEFIHSRYQDHQDEYDLILCNPPYFSEKNYRLGENKKRNICRFQIDAAFIDLALKIKELLRLDGRAYISLPYDIEHGKKEYDHALSEFKKYFKVEENIKRGYCFLTLLHL